MKRPRESSGGLQDGGLGDLFARGRGGGTPQELQGLNPLQVTAVEAIVRGHNVFLTGPPGTGKSHVLRRVVPALQDRGLDAVVTSLTGSAALLVGGRTLHSALGLGLGNQPAARIVRQMARRRAPALARARNMDVLIIDEVSMLSVELLELADDVLRRVRKLNEPFGGVQVVLVGDFCQLPPVQGSYCFLSPVWEGLELLPVALRDVVRQRDDVALQTVLADVRFGNPVDASLLALSTRLGARFEGPVQPTRLFPRRAQADAVNERELGLLVGNGAEARVYPRRAMGRKAEFYADAHGVPAQIKLAVGAQVVVTRNLDQDAGIVNGTRGVVRELRPLGIDIQLAGGGLHRVGYVESRAEGDEPVSVFHVPLQLAYALTIHRAQGMTLDRVEMDLGPAVFAVGQAYTALSRARCLASLTLLDLDPNCFRADRHVTEFYANLPDHARGGGKAAACS